MAFSIVRKPAVSEDELAKLKKSKGNKTLKLEDLEEWNLRGLLEVDSLKQEGETEYLGRIQIESQNQEE